jgi:adenine-specific DNA-methyltransferase
MAYRYLGNKTRLVDVIIGAVEEVASPGVRVADPMCGTATVADELATAGFRVVAADELTFAVRHARVRLLLNGEPAFAALGGYERALAKLNCARPVEEFFFAEYSGAGAPRNGCKPRCYFTGDNARRIDAVRGKLASWRARGLLTEREDDLLTHDLIMAANRVANIAGTYGYYRSSWNGAALQPLVLRPSVIGTVRRGHAVHQGRVEDLVANLDADVLYLDPPYTKRQYAGNYHILETLAVGDEFDPVGKGGLRHWYDQYSAFCSKRLVGDAFRAVMERNTARWVLLSYSEDGLVAPAELAALLGEFGDVSRRDVALPRFRSNGGRTSAVTEHLYCVDTA